MGRVKEALKQATGLKSGSSTEQIVKAVQKNQEDIEAAFMDILGGVEMVALGKN